MLLALAVCSLLAADADGADDTPAAPAVLPLPSELKPIPPDEPSVEEQQENQRVRRIGLTLGGGAVGVALPLLIGWGLQTAAGPCMFMFGTCDHDLGMTFMFSALPATVGLGLGLGHHFTGGRAGVGFGLGGALGGYLTASVLLGFISLSAGRDWASTFPAAGGGVLAAFGLIGGVAGLELRHEALEAGSTEWSLGRALASSLVFWIPAALTEAAAVYLGVAAGYGSYNSSQGFLAAIIITLGTVVTLVGASAAAWGTHRAMGGRGAGWTAAIGALASASVAGLFLGLHAHAPPAGGIFSGRAGTSPFGVVALASAIASVGPGVALEWSSSLNAMPDEVLPTRVDELQVQAGFAPTPGGGLISLSGRF